MGRYKHMTINGVVYQAHRVIWEQANGPIPPGFDIHHKDNNPHNNSLENLMCLSHADHIALHTKQRQEGTETQPNDIVLRSRQELRDCYRANRDKRIAHQKEYYKANKDAINERRKKFRDEHKEEINEKGRERYLKNKDVIRERGKVYRETHREEVAERHTKYYHEHKDAVIEYQKKYREDHKEMIRKQRAEHYRKNADKIKAYKEAHKEELRAYGRWNSARKRGASPELVEKRRLEYEAIKAKRKPSI